MGEYKGGKKQEYEETVGMVFPVCGMEEQVTSSIQRYT